MTERVTETEREEKKSNKALMIGMVVAIVLAALSLTTQLTEKRLSPEAVTWVQEVYDKNKKQAEDQVRNIVEENKRLKDEIAKSKSAETPPTPTPKGGK